MVDVNGVSNDTGGEISADFASQAIVGMAGGVLAAGGRNTPDVSFDADPYSGARVIIEGVLCQYGTDELASALFVGLWARVKAAYGGRLIGNVTIYNLVNSGYYASTLHDVTTGSSCSEPAGPNYDLATGWGSVKIAATINAISSNFLSQPSLTSQL